MQYLIYLYDQKPTIYTGPSVPALHHEKEKVWLPRMEDLTGMYRNSEGGTDYMIICNLQRFIKVTATDEDISTTANEWMLRLLMDALYNKSWDGELWMPPRQSRQDDVRRVPSGAESAARVFCATVVSSPAEREERSSCG